MAFNPLVVEAIYAFKGSNNDELCLKKGDIITVTQKDEGWWEGTLNGRTGWFPSNYVKEVLKSPTINNNNSGISPLATIQGCSSNHTNPYKAIVLKDLINSERAHTIELCELVTKFLQPLQNPTTGVLTRDEYQQLTGNLTQVLATHQHLLMLIEAEELKNGLEQKVGKVFLGLAPRVKAVHQVYCALHPKAVCILDKYKDNLGAYMESKEATSPGILVLTALLSKPFRRLDKYAGMLQELERHVEECHADRGDIQRSVAVYKDIATGCVAVRRQKELELQVLTGPIRDWEGPALSTLGEIIHMGSVAIGRQHLDRYFVLFPGTLLILAVSHRFSAFIYEGQVPLTGGCQCCALNDDETQRNAFEIRTPMIDTVYVVCQTRHEAIRWCDLLTQQIVAVNSTTPGTKQQSQIFFSSNNQQLQNSCNTPTLDRLPLLSSYDRNWSSVRCLRPLPSHQPCLAFSKVDAENSDLNNSTNHHLLHRNPITTYKEDVSILDVIETYYAQVQNQNGIARKQDILTGGNVQTYDRILTNSEMKSTVNANSTRTNLNFNHLLSSSGLPCFVMPFALRKPFDSQLRRGATTSWCCTPGSNY